MTGIGTADISGQVSFKITYAFRTNELGGVALILAERIDQTVHSIPVIALSGEFPYRNSSDELCLMCEPTEDRSEAIGDGRHYCRYCSQCLSDLSIPKCLQHTASHILHDPRLKGYDSPCGLCTNSQCRVYLKKSTKTMVIDPARSTCELLGTQKFNLKDASTMSEKSPSTNHPLQCPLCHGTQAAVWKYNFRAHILQDHPSANVDLYKEKFIISEAEKTLLKGVYRTKNRKSRKRRAKDSAPRPQISEAHSARIVLRYVLFVLI